MSGKLVVGMLFVGGVIVATAAGVTISPNDDTFIYDAQPGTPQDAPGLASAGLVCKYQGGQRRISFLEYTIPDLNYDVTNATFNLTYFKSIAYNVGWTFRVLGSNAAAGFDETTLTNTLATGTNGINTIAYTQIGSDIVLAGGTYGGTAEVWPNVPVSVDITSYFNSHKNQTVVFKVTPATTSNNNAGGAFQDRELSRTMAGTGIVGQVPAGPFISYVPEPASLGLVLLASVFVMRRRAA